MQQSSKRLINNTPGVDGVLRGLEKASKIITSTMGGTGKNVLMYEDGELSFTKDGVSVAKKIKFNDTEEDAGAQLLINAANNTVKECGDGTTLTSLLTYQFVDKLFKLQPVNDWLDSTDKAISEVIDDLLILSKKVETYDDIYKIALTSSKSPTVANLIKQIYTKTGLGAKISVEISKNFNYTYNEITEGLTFDSPFIHEGFGNQPNGYCSFENPMIYFLDEPQNDFREATKMIDPFNKQGIPLVLIAPSFSEGFIRDCLTNKQHYKLQICLIKTPGYGATIEENKRDFNAFTTGNTANKITVTPYDFTIYNNPNKKKIKNRVKQLEAKLEVEAEDFTANDYRRRIVNLQQTSAIIYVGGITEKNAQEEFDRIEDAVGACRSAVKMGYVLGQGVALKSIAEKYDGWFKEVLESPYFTILNNALQGEPNKLLPFNVRTREYDENLVDPSMVIISALRNSFALARLLINTSYTLYD